MARPLILMYYTFRNTNKKITIGVHRNTTALFNHGLLETGSIKTLKTNDLLSRLGILEYLKYIDNAEGKS